MGNYEQATDRENARDALAEARKAALGEHHERADAFIRIADAYLRLGLSEWPHRDPRVASPR